MNPIVGLLTLIYFAIRSATRGRRHGWRTRESLQQDFDSLVSEHGGEAFQAGWRTLVYVSPDKSVELKVQLDHRPRLVLRIRKSYPFSFIFYRLPRLVFAFLEAFLEPRTRSEGTFYLLLSQNYSALDSIRDRPGFVPHLQSLNQAGLSGQMGPYGLKLWKRLSADDCNAAYLSEIIHTARDFAQTCDPEWVKIPVQPLFSEKRCAYCKESLEDSDSIQYCTTCGTPHHNECLKLNGRCSVYGCEQPPYEPQETERRFVDVQT